MKIKKADIGERGRGNTCRKVTKSIQWTEDLEAKTNG